MKNPQIINFLNQYNKKEWDSIIEDLILYSINQVNDIEKNESPKNNAEKYFSEERCMFLVKKAILSMLYDAGTCLLFLLHIKKLINKLILPLMYFLPLLFKSAIILAGLISLENYFDLIDALPFVCGLFYYFKLVGNGELKITKLKDEGEEEEEEEEK